MSAASDHHANLVLVGFMGSGKSTVGRRLARALGWRFVDLDRLIEARAGRTIAAIFATDGEGCFRDLESTLLAELLGSERLVLATGGGVVGREVNRRLLGRLGTVIYLRANWPTLQQRLAQGSGRPLADPQQGWEPVRELWQGRLAWYEEAEIVIDTDALTAREVVAALLKRLGPREDERCNS